MESEFYPLINVREVMELADFTIPRARALADAVGQQRDFSIVQLFVRDDGAKVALEIIVVDVECDGVPPRNPFGIHYRERLALCVLDDPKKLVEVHALRKGFPILLHQQQSSLGSPANLCLYFEPPVSVLRTWTPQNFLRRVQWWLEKSARDELHPADQPVEHLFFTTKYELVLPWNFEELKKTSEQRFSIRAGRERSDGGVTLFMEVMPRGTSTDRGIASIDLTLPPVKQSQLEHDPATLGELADLLLTRGIDIASALRTEVQSGVDEKGVAAKADESFMVILLHLPIVREEGKEPERLVRRAFLLGSGVQKLGLAINALILHAGRYFKDAMGSLDTRPSASWRSENVSPLELLRFNDTKSARLQSGISEEGTESVLVGAGSLGSAMLHLWGRSGWGRWTVIDKDHIKPHNLARHAAYAHHVGDPKAEVVAQLHAAVTQGASVVVPICADASDIAEKRVRNPLTAAKLVVDASTTLEYPRLASTLDGVGRHMSAFISPDGNAAVLLVEDEERTVRLRTLEAQYYRALIQEPWGEHHLAGNLGSFWSGASCRDISMVLPYSRILGHASNLAEQVRVAAGRPIPSIRVWSRDRDAGSVTVHSVPVFPEKLFHFDELVLFIDEGVEQKLRALRTRKAPSETGGVLLGYYDFNVKAVVIVDGLPAPADSKSTSAWFERGVEGLARAVADASKRTAGIVGYVGEWHSHPPGHSAAPSGNDVVQLAYLARGMAEDGLPAVSLIVGEHDMQVMQGVLRE